MGSKVGDPSRGGGIAVSVHVLYSDYPSLNPADVTLKCFSLYRLLSLLTYYTQVDLKFEPGQSLKN